MYHIFHFDCIVASVTHGNLTCPTCRGTLPFQQDPLLHYPRSTESPEITLLTSPSQHQFDNDEPISSTTQPNNGSARGGDLTIKALPGYAALSSLDCATKFPVLVSVCAPSLRSDQGGYCAPVDDMLVGNVSLCVNAACKAVLVRLCKKQMAHPLGIFPTC